MKNFFTSFIAHCSRQFGFGLMLRMFASMKIAPQFLAVLRLLTRGA